MPGIESSLASLGGFDLLATQTTYVHRLDPRTKILTTLAFAVTVVSYGKYELSGLMPLLIFPVFVAAAGNIPVGFLLSRLLAAAPFVLLVGVSNPFFDRTPLMHAGPFCITGGWVSYASMILRFMLTVSAGLLLVATTGFNSTCTGLMRLGAPRPLVMQLMLLYRYLFVLAQEAASTAKAWSLRSVADRRMSFSVFRRVVGQLLVRALDRSQRIHMAMLSRGFSGEFRALKPLRPGYADAVYMGSWIAFFIIVRAANVPRLLGHALLGVF